MVHCGQTEPRLQARRSAVSGAGVVRASTMAHARRTRLVLLFSAIGVVLACFAGASFFLYRLVTEVRGGRDLWLAASGEPVPDGFRFAMFEVDDGSAVDGGRAILNTWGELHDGGDAFTVFDAAGAEHALPKDSLVFTCPPDRLAERAARLNSTLVAWADATDMRQIDIHQQAAFDGTPEVWRLTIHWKAGGFEAFYYAVDNNGRPRPIRWTSGRYPD